MTRLQRQSLAALLVSVATATAVAALLLHWGDPRRAQAGFALLGLTPLVFLIRGEAGDPLVQGNASRFARQFRWGYIILGLTWLVLEGYLHNGVPTAFALSTALVLYLWQSWLAGPGEGRWPEYDERETQVGGKAYKLAARVVLLAFILCGTTVPLAWPGGSVPSYTFGLQVYAAWWLAHTCVALSVLWQESQWQR